MEHLIIGNSTTQGLKNFARNLCINQYNWTEEDVDSLIKLWDKESEWNPTAENPDSGAYGIPQSLPANKMASEGSDYRTNGETQIKWGLKYIKQRYGTPTNAWETWQSRSPHWY